MKTLGFSFLLCLFSPFFSCTESSVGNFRIGVQPNEANRNLNHFEKELEKRLGQSVTVKVSKDYAETVSMLESGQVEMAVLSPLNFVIAEKDLKLKVLFKKVYGESEFYYAAIVTKKGSRIKKLSDLKGKKIAFVDKSSASGFLYPRVMLKEASLELSDIESIFKGTHVDAVKAVNEGEVDAAAVWANPPAQGGGAWTAEEFKEQTLDLTVLAYSDPIPNDAIVIKEDFYKSNPAFVLRLMDSLILMSEREQSSIKQVFGVDKLATATSSHYEGVRKLQKVLEE
ncbi:phosphate/phosphite/phosphonate ABC transporter substrate-binding protein [bacterium]|nr:phosphate/phosphite/phosphonate ABC transporter substrate-binding protein [bacterium]